MNIGFFDIETTGFHPEKDEILVVCIANNATSRVKVIKKGKMTEEEVIRESLSSMLIYGSIVSWNGSSFDVPFLSKRAQKYGLRFNHKFHVDLMKKSSKFLPNVEKSLESMASALLIDANLTEYDASIWKMAKRGDKNAMNYIVEHCSSDVIALKRVWNKIME